MQTTNKAVGSCRSQAGRAGEFFSRLSPDALRDLTSLEHPTSYPANVILF